MGFEGRRDIRGQVLLDGLLESADETDEIDPGCTLSEPEFIQLPLSRHEDMRVMTYKIRVITTTFLDQT